MQESGPSARGSRLNDRLAARSVARRSADATVPRAMAERHCVPRRRRRIDPVAREGTRSSAGSCGDPGVIILWLAGVLSAIVFGLINASVRRAPRPSATSLLHEATVQSGKADSQTYARLRRHTHPRGPALQGAGRALDQALRTAKTDKSYLSREQAQLLGPRRTTRAPSQPPTRPWPRPRRNSRRSWTGTCKANRKASAGAVMPDFVHDRGTGQGRGAAWRPRTTRGRSRRSTSTSKMQPTDSDVLVTRAAAKVKVGDKKGAAADYRAALKYIPDYQPALDGLKQIGASK